MLQFKAILSILVFQVVICSAEVISNNETLPLAWSVSAITNETGLSNSAVTSIYTDSRGYIWFGTWDGLNRYDGASIITFYPESHNEFSLSNNIIWDIFEDADKNLWIITERGINLYDRKFNRFYNWFSSPHYSLSSERSLRACINFDGQLLLSVYGEGLFRFEPQKRNFLPLALNLPEKGLEKTIRGVAAFDSLIFLLHENLMLSVLHSNGNLVESYPVVKEAFGEKLNPNHNWFFTCGTRHYLAIAGRVGGLWITDLQQKNNFLIKEDSFEHLFTTLYKVDEKEYLLAGTDNGNIFRIYPKQHFRYESILDQLPTFSENRVKVWTIAYSEPLLWIGTDGEGVYQFNTRPKAFRSIIRGPAEQRMLSHQIVRAVLEDAEGRKWIGTRGNGLNMIPASGEATKVINKANGLSSNAVLSLAEDAHGNLWIGVDGQGVHLLEKETGRIMHFPSDLAGAEELDFGPVYDICIDVFGTVWLGSSGKGLHGLSIEKQNGSYHLNHYVHLAGRGGENDLMGNIVFAIKEEKPNILWIGVRMGGLHRYNTLTGEILHFDQGPNIGQGLNNNDILCLHMGNDRTLWIGTSGGLNHLNLSGGSYSFTHFTVNDGLPNHTIHGILEDNYGNIWVSTNKGLSRLLRPENRFINYNSGDGLLNNEFTDGAVFHHLPSGRFYFGGINGVDWFYPDQINISKQQPEVILTDFKLFNQRILPGDKSGILPVNIAFLDQVTLKHNQNFFGIEFTTINFLNAPKIRFAYKLENFNTEWLDAGMQREIVFTNVPHGKYNLMIKATNRDGFWSEHIRTLNIIITPPFWQTSYAYFAYFLFLLATAYLIYYYQSLRIKRQQQLAFERLNQKKERELNQYKFEFFTNLAHEFRTPLTLIFASAASLFDKAYEADANKSLIRTVYMNARRLQKMIDELMAFQKLDAGREKPDLQNGELVSFIAEITNVFSHYANENEVELSFEPEVNELFVSFDSEKIERILLNLLSNSAKFTPAGGSISIKLYTKKSNIILQVNDTGSGISPKDLPYIFDKYYHRDPPNYDLKTISKGSGIGLTYTKRLVKLLGGHIHVSSKEGLGSSFTVELPLVKSTDKQAPAVTAIRQKSHVQLLNSIAEDFFQNPNQKLVPECKTTSRHDRPSKYRLLIVEDDLQLLQLLQNLLSPHYDVYAFVNGHEALELLKTKRIDLVVSDVIMPEMDGLTLCKAIKDNVITSHIPIVLLTARSETEHVIEGLEQGADAYIAKPFHPRQLFVTIDRLITTREQLIRQLRKTLEQNDAYDQDHLSEHDRNLLQKALSYIENNFHRDNLNADMMADHLAMSKAQLYRKIKALTGITPHGLIKNFRLNTARKMISIGKHTVSDIIFMTGFNNRTYFYRSYRDYFGETPGEISKRNRVKA